MRAASKRKWWLFFERFFQTCDVSSTSWCFHGKGDVLCCPPSQLHNQQWDRGVTFLNGTSFLGLSLGGGLSLGRGEQWVGWLCRWPLRRCQQVLDWLQAFISSMLSAGSLGLKEEACFLPANQDLGRRRGGSAAAPRAAKGVQRGAGWAQGSQRSLPTSVIPSVVLCCLEVPALWSHVCDSQWIAVLAVVSSGVMQDRLPVIAQTLCASVQFPFVYLHFDLCGSFLSAIPRIVSFLVMYDHSWFYSLSAKAQDFCRWVPVASVNQGLLTCFHPSKQGRAVMRREHPDGCPPAGLQHFSLRSRC